MKALRRSRSAAVEGERRRPARRTILFALALIVPLGLSTKFYYGPLGIWVRDYAGGFFYELFWILVLALVRPSLHPRSVSLLVLVATCLLEFLQLWPTPALEPVRSNLVGRALIGESFSWLDFPFYLAGSALGYLMLKSLRPLPEPQTPPA